MNKNERIYVDLHVLQTVPPSCVNRDDTGSPKTAIYGGVTRARVSSQAWKHAMRERFKELLTDADMNAVAYRTKKVFDLLAREVRQIDSNMEKGDAERISKEVWKLIEITEDPKSESSEAKVLIFVSKMQLNGLAQWAIEKKDELLKLSAQDEKEDKKEDKKEKKYKKTNSLADEVVELMKRDPTWDQALFGRMVANKAVLNFDAAAQVAHAISTHAVENEYDFFTAVDDCAPKDNTVAAYMGTVEFNSSTLYRYATVNVGDLQTMLGEKTPEAVRAFAEAFIRSMPTGKQKSCANWTQPDAVYVAVRRGQPVNLAGAFEEPVKAGTGGYVAESERRLAAYAQETYASFASAPVLSLTAGKGLDELAAPCPVDALLDALEAWLKNGGEQQ